MKNGCVLLPLVIGGFCSLHPRANDSGLNAAFRFKFTIIGRCGFDQTSSETPSF
mgnify:CR=1 FL=1